LAIPTSARWSTPSSSSTTPASRSLPHSTTCVRSTFQVMALPPLAEGDKLDVRYPFKFANE
jgi:hypothetical protein